MRTLSILVLTICSLKSLGCIVPHLESQMRLNRGASNREWGANAVLAQSNALLILHRQAAASR
jgi:hypothetical protein